MIARITKSRHPSIYLRCHFCLAKCGWDIMGAACDRCNVVFCDKCEPDHDYQHMLANLAGD